VLVDADETGGVTRLLPSGPLREPLAALGRADVVVVCDRDGAAPGLPAIAGPLVVHASFAAVALVRPGANGWEEASLGTLAGQRVLVVSGVARPAPLYGALREWQAELAQVLEYPDHHVYGPRAWQEIAHAAKDVDLVVTTEKDLVKLERFPFARGKLVALRLGVTIDRPEALIGRVLGLAPGRQS
jgi:tetraacyldisaccharide 4'-kinase